MPMIDVALPVFSLGCDVETDAVIRQLR